LVTIERGGHLFLGHDGEVRRQSARSSRRPGRSQHEAQRCGPRRDRLAGPVARRAAGVPDGPVGPGPLALMSFCRPGETGVIGLAGRADGFRPIPLSASIAAAGLSS
jgi:hypothetical protein